MSEMPQGGKMAQPADVTEAAREGRCGTIPGGYKESRREVRGADVPVTFVRGRKWLFSSLGLAKPGLIARPQLPSAQGSRDPGCDLNADFTLS